MSNIINRIKKDTQIVECKKRAKEILKEYLNRKASLLSKDLTLMQCLEIAAKEMNYNSWYELRQNIKNKEIKNEHILSNYTQKWDKYEEKESPSKYIRYHVMTSEERQLTKSYEKLKQGKVSEFLRLNSQDFHSNKYEEVLKGQIEL